MERIKELLVEEKKHIRFGDWKDKEVIAEIVFPLIMNALVGLYVDILRAFSRGNFSVG